MGNEELIEEFDLIVASFEVIERIEEAEDKVVQGLETAMLCE